MDKFIEWVLTIPGMLICGGVLLLLIAIIILIFTSVKSKKGDSDEKPKKDKKKKELFNEISNYYKENIPVFIGFVISFIASLVFVFAGPEGIKKFFKNHVKWGK